MIEVNVKKARENLSELLDKIEKGEEIIITRRGKRVAHMVSPKRAVSLPSLKSLRESIEVRGEPLGVAVMKNRQEERY